MHRGNQSVFRRNARRPLVTAAVLVFLLSLGFAAPAQAAYSATPKSTWSANGTVFAVAVRGDVVFLGGKFTELRDPATRATIPAGGLAALDRTTGDPLWTASANGEVQTLAVSADGTKVFAGGAFTAVNGTHAKHLVALRPGTGVPVAGWQGAASGSVQDLVVSGTALYVAGPFGTMNGVKRHGLARLNSGSGSLQPWSSSTNGGRPRAIALAGAGNALIVGGNFTSLGGKSRKYLGSVSTATGKATGWTPPARCGTCYVFDVDTDATGIYAASGGPGGHLTAFSTGNDQARWAVTADGNVQAVAVSDGRVYAGGHFDHRFGGAVRHQLAAVTAGSGALTAFAPDTTKPYPGVWALEPRPDALFVGGGFSGVGDATGQAHFAEFTTL